MIFTKLQIAVLMLEDGSYYRGWSIGKSFTSIGEIVFNTGMTGYQEIFTDPSYSGQLVVFTYPELGNTGINDEDCESNNLAPKGLIIKNISSSTSNWRKKKSLYEYLLANNIACIYGIDTRALTRHLRKYGSMNGGISNMTLNLSQFLNQIKNFPRIKSLDLIQSVTTKKSFIWSSINNMHWINFSSKHVHLTTGLPFIKIVVLDFGYKLNILRQLSLYRCSLLVVPANTLLYDIVKFKPDGIMLTNGPGDPALADYAIKTIKGLINIKKNLPIFGICMGHQILSLALGADTFKLKFGHRALNHPTGISKKVVITSQNHGFAVNLEPMGEVIPNIQITHYNLNDNTLAGISHFYKPLFSVQYHPEANPGPNDSLYFFNNFLAIIKYYKLF
uniref:Carbamoyl phosphate synthase small chain n=1 Tax=Boldia erythrosiphon TaxID=74908 RepID=A0A1Y9TM15_9RHOD|nr:carbamoyl phosphate synthase small subunit [Boldia erythrosiphon]ARO90676.1 carbamoyl phosphate synthase small subunit [Boldia erythrosiphon]